MHSEHTTLGLIGAIYDAVNDGELWPIFLEKLAGALRCAATNLFVQDLRHPSGSASATFGTDPSFTRSYADHYGKVNVYLIRGKRLLKPGGVYFSDELCPNEQATDSEFVNDWVRPQGQGHGLLATIFNNDSVAGNIGAMRARTAKPFSIVEKRILQALIPHLQRAVALKRRIAHLEALQKDDKNALDSWSTAVFIVGRDGDVRLANGTAAMLVRGRDGLTADRNILQAASSNDSAKLLRIIRDAAETPHGHQPSSTAMLVARPSGRTPLQILVFPSVREDVFFGGRGSALVFVYDPESTERLQEEVLRRLYHLTPAEAYVTVLLATGRSVKEIADESAIRANTVRVHLKKIYDKTGTRRQAELVKRILSGPATLRMHS
jgi:DNA-binding CsgD family transcriptional regulator